jgi:hypothetical protein
LPATQDVSAGARDLRRGRPRDRSSNRHAANGSDTPPQVFSLRLLDRTGVAAQTFDTGFYGRGWILSGTTAYLLSKPPALDMRYRTRRRMAVFCSPRQIRATRISRITPLPNPKKIFEAAYVVRCWNCALPVLKLKPRIVRRTEEEDRSLWTSTGSRGFTVCGRRRNPGIGSAAARYRCYSASRVRRRRNVAAGSSASRQRSQLVPLTQPNIEAASIPRQSSLQRHGRFRSALF